LASQLAGHLTGQLKETLPETVELLERTATLRRVLSGRILMWMPLDVKIK
jgi:hypothetical protein